MSRFRITRRRLLGVAAATGVTGFVLARDAGVAGNAETDLAGTGVLPGSAGSTGAADLTPPVAAWLDGMLSGDDLSSAHAALASLASLSSGERLSSGSALQPRTLESDLIWQWRRSLAQELSSGVRAVAITRWDKAILLSGLAREASLPVRQKRIAHSLFQTEIG